MELYILLRLLVTNNAYNGTEMFRVKFEENFVILCWLMLAYTRTAVHGTDKIFSYQIFPEYEDL